MAVKADYFISLIGKNPMPNYIAALNYCTCNTKIILICTEECDESISTKSVAKNINLQLKKKLNNKSVEIKSCDKSCSKEIENTIVKIFKGISSKTDNIILDYTGGTKVMSAIFYDRFQERSAKHGYTNLVACYVSNKKSEGCIYSESLNSNRLESIRIRDIFNGYNITCDDVINLHGYTLSCNKQNGEIQGIKRRNSTEQRNYSKLVSVELNPESYNLKCVFKCTVKKEMDSALIEDYFIFKDIAEKIGGSEAEMIIRIEMPENLDIEINEMEDYFYDRISNISTTNIRNKVKLENGGE